MITKNKINEKINYCQVNLNSAISDFISSNKRQDRDRVIKIKAKLEAFNEILKLV